LGKKREQIMDKYEKCKNIATVIIAKNRNGPIGEIDLYFNPTHTAFGNLDDSANQSLSKKTNKYSSKSINSSQSTKTPSTSDEEWYKSIKESTVFE
jgi:hypothetical protein